jgi:hypothetical protein
MTDDAETRIAELERENRELRGELVKLRPPPRVIPPDGPFALPDLDQTERLTRRVLERYPNLYGYADRNSIAAHEFVRMVRGGMLYVASLHRLRGEVMRTHSSLDWLCKAGDYLNIAGHPQTVLRGGSVFVAVIASGDVCFSPPSLYPLSDFGLLVGQRHNSFAATNRWLSVMAGEFDPKLVIEPPTLRHSPLPPPMNLAPKTAWRDGM